MVISFTSPLFYDIEVIKVKDKKGNLPLHLACFNSNAGSDLINKLIILYPEALQIPNDKAIYHYIWLVQVKPKKNSFKSYLKNTQMQQK